jgi:sRNA-binding carbon storage regulator CsrA
LITIPADLQLYGGFQMLVLKRGKDESIVISTSDGEIRLMITDASGPVSIGIDAPRSCTVLREELVSEQALPEVSERTLEQTGSR